MARILTKIKEHCHCWQDQIIRAYKTLYLHCGLSTKVDSICQNKNLWINEVIEENESKFKKSYSDFSTHLRNVFLKLCLNVLRFFEHLLV